VTANSNAFGAVHKRLRRDEGGGIGQMRTEGRG